MHYRFSQILIAASLCLTLPLAKVDAQKATQAVKSSADSALAAKNARMAWWRDARFGMFIHWGVYSVPAGRYEGKYYPGLGEWIMHDARIPRAQYQQFAKSFNPVQYDPDAWVRMAKDAGVKYIVITSKHHDGFALFDSKASDWNVVKATPYGKDLLKPLAEACRKYGMKLGFYYSQANDWNNPGGAADGGHWDSTQNGSMDDYIKNVAVPQVKEILTHYGDVAELWWDVPTGMTPERAAEFLPLLKLQPNVVVNNRLGGGVKGDLETPEQYIPPTGMPGRDWETCMTINDTWGFKTDDTNWKSSETLIRNLIDIASKGGNYLLNIGPTSEGTIPPAIVQRMHDIGRWMKVNGESIYGTSASKFSHLDWGRSTTKTEGNVHTLYLQVFNWPKDGKLFVPDIRNHPAKAYLLEGGKPLEMTYGTSGLYISVPKTAPDTIATVIVIRVTGPLVIAVPPPPTTVSSADGSFLLSAVKANLKLSGEGPQLEGDPANQNIGYWTDTAANATWNFTVQQAGTFDLFANVATPADSSACNIRLAQLPVSVHAATGILKLSIKKTGGYRVYQDQYLGQMTIPSAGKYYLTLFPDGAGWNPINLRSITLKPVKK